MTPPYRTLSRCRICDGDLRAFLSLGETPLANAFIRPDRVDAAEARFPLESARCSECSLVQLTVVVDPEVMFRDYVYASSASAPLLAHFDDLAAAVARDFAPPGALVVEFGSNDGLLLRSLGSRGIRALGVEPATKIAARANEEGLETLNEFFDVGLAGRIRDERGPASAVLANNVLAHVDDLTGVVRALDRLLADDGVFIAEVPYLQDLLAHVEYDTIYHEHLSYFHLAPLQRLFTSAGFELFDVLRLPIHGGSIRIHVARKGRRAPTVRLRELLSSEEPLATEAPYIEFAAQVRSQRTQLVALLRRLKAEGHRLAGYGATAKGNTMLNYCGIDASVLDYIADTTPYKQGLLTPGTHIPVRPESSIAESRPDAMLLLAWNYADSIVERHRDYLAGGGRFIHPIPVPRLIPE
jgi:SAM-dependent methyltransferase